MRLLRWLVVLVLLVVAVALQQGWKAFGKSADGARRARMERSPQWQDGHFENPEPLWNDAWGMMLGALHMSDHTSPQEPLVPAQLDKAVFNTQPSSGLRVTWLGHSTLLVEIDGRRFLTDPVWSDRISPISWVGPRRWYAPPIAFADLPPIDAVVISHDHYDHLDYGTISAMKSWPTPFIVPLGVGAHLADWGIAEDRIIELDWWESTRIGDITINCTPARHATGRLGFFDFDATLWASYAFVGPTHRVYFSGDTGLFPAMKDIGDRYGPFDLTMIESGQYHASWPDWHIGPEQAVTAHRLLKGRIMLPIHWALLALAYHGWTEPPERVLAASHGQDNIALPRPGQPFEPTILVPQDHWWPNIPWQTADQAPVVSTKLGSLTGAQIGE